jgi:kynurenine formamidase
MPFEHFKLVELTQPLFKKVPTWSGGCGFCLEIKKDYDQVFRVNQIEMEAGIGTHIDAPCHLYKGGLSIEKIPLDNLITEACIIDVSSKATADYEISVEDIEEYEKMYGLIPKGSIVVGYTGWSRFWFDSATYRNMDSNGQMHFPAFSAKASEALLARDIAGIAIDTLSPDCLDSTYPVHRLILGVGKFIIENIGNCSQIPPKGAYLIALPLNLEGATESPMRIVGLIPKPI